MFDFKIQGTFTMLKRFFIKSTTVKTSFFIFSTLALMACGDKAPLKAPPKPAVSVYTIKSDTLGDYREVVARTQASKEADIRARVTGELIKRDFKEGSIIQKDQVLFTIDPTAFETSLASAKAQLASKKSGEENSKRNLIRAKKLINDGYISQSDFDRLTTEESQASSSVAAAKSAVEQAELDLSYTVITAPFTGRIGRVNYNVGNIIGPDSGVLASLILSDPMYVNFQIEESVYISHLQDVAKNKSENNGKQKLKDALDLTIRLPNNSTYNQYGKLDFANTKITEGMGTVEVRAIFPNPKGVIIPGLFVTLIIEGKNKKNMSLVPQAAVQSNQQGKFVLLLDEDNKVKQRHIVLGRRINAMWAVEDGLEEGDRVIVEGLQKVRSGVEVNPIQKNIDSLTGTLSLVEKEKVVPNKEAPSNDESSENVVNTAEENK